ncbi:unnamed protein product [Haemonchus placei]|uniref:Uncharacterized protein n=1 Tax=Haemonchus placei TaxID=6290 RepID=A0A0N4WX49_HAEPC|nr:unnamed protein product [Haemonchus placei]
MGTNVRLCSQCSFYGSMSGSALFYSLPCFVHRH